MPDIYAFASKLPTKDGFAYPEQLRRAVLSISLNIAEGHGRRTEENFAQFLRISLGSLNEVEALLILGAELGYLTESELKAYEDRIRTLAVKLSNFISVLNSNVVREPEADYESDSHVPPSPSTSSNCPATSSYFASFFTKFNAFPLMQNRSPLGAGPSGKTCPRWPSHFAQRTSTRVMP